MTRDKVTIRQDRLTPAGVGYWGVVCPCCQWWGSAYRWNVAVFLAKHHIRTVHGEDTA